MKGLNIIEYSRVVGLTPEKELTDKEKYYRNGMNKMIRKMLKIKKYKSKNEK